MIIRLLAGLVIAIASLSASRADAGETLKIGVLTDISSFGADVTGTGSVTAARMAVADFGGAVHGKKVEIVFADTQNKPDIAVGIARRWIDEENIDVITDLPQSAVSLAVQQIARERHKIDIVTSGVTADLTGRACSPYAVHWAEDTNALAAGTAGALLSAGFKSWYFVAADFAFGHTMQNAAKSVVERMGGSVVGTVWPPVNTADFSSFILTAEASPAQVVAFVTVGADFIASIKQAHEFGLASSGKKLAGLITYLSDIHSLGLDIAKGLLVTTSFYWDQSDSARSFGSRFEAVEGRKPNKTHAALYTAITHYLKAVDASDAEDVDAVMKHMKDTPADYFGKQARIREDGRVVFDLDVYEVKSPSESHSEWDYYRKVKTIPGSQAFAPVDREACAFLRK